MLARPGNPNTSTRSFFTARSQQPTATDSNSPKPSRDQDSGSPSTQTFNTRGDSVLLGRRYDSILNLNENENENEYFSHFLTF